MTLNIHYEDDHILVAEKPANVPSQPDPSGDPDMVTLLKQQIQKRDALKKAPYIGLHHRLDRHVGGLLAFGKSKEGNLTLSQQIQNRSIEKAYLAILCGQLDQSVGEITNHIKKLGQRNVSKIVSPNVHGAKEARLKYEVLCTLNHASFGTLSLVTVQLETGRHHQIRVQFAHEGTPLLGDRKYNKVCPSLPSDIPLCLFAYKLTFKNVQGELIHVASPPPLQPGFELFHDCMKNAAL